MKRHESILCFSGGVDSYIAWHYLGKPMCMYVDFGHRYADREKRVIDKLVHLQSELDVVVRQCQWVCIYERSDAFIPARNRVLTTFAAWAADKVYLTLQKGELELYDRSKEFCEKESVELTRHHGREITVDSPFWLMTKSEMVKWYVDQGLSVSDLYLTWSCYWGSAVPCASCQACFRRWVAFSHSGLTEPWYSKMAEWSGVQVYKEKMERGEYDPERTKETMEVFKKYGIIKGL